MPLPALLDPSTDRSLLPPGVGYLLVAIAFLVLLPIAYGERPTAHHLQTEALVSSYVSSSTARGIALSPVLTFTDREGKVQEVTLPSSASQKLLPEGGKVNIAYLDTSSTQLILENDPYQAFTKNLLRVIGIPYALLGAALLALYLIKGRTGLVDWSVFGAKIVLPWLLGISFLVYAFWPSSTGALANISFRGNSGGEITGPQVLSILFFIGYFIWYVLQWPLMIIRVAVRAYKTYKKSVSEPLPEVARFNKWL